MEHSQLTTFLRVVSEKSFSRAAHSLARSQPAISMTVHRLESELGKKLVDRTPKGNVLTDAGQIVYGYAQKIEALHREMTKALSELSDKHAGKLTIGANENGALYASDYIDLFRQRYPRIKVEIRRSLSRSIPSDVLENHLDLGVVSYRASDPNLGFLPIYSDVLSFIVYPNHRLAKCKEIPIRELGLESFIAHNVASPYRQLVHDTFQKYAVPLNIDLEMPTVEAVKKMIIKKMGVSFLPRICVQEELAKYTLVEVAVREFKVDRSVFLVFPAKRVLSHTTAAFLELAKTEKANVAKSNPATTTPRPWSDRHRAIG